MTIAAAAGFPRTAVPQAADWPLPLRTGTKFETLARGIKPVIRSRRLCSSLSSSRGAIWGTSLAYTAKLCVEPLPAYGAAWDFQKPEYLLLALNAGGG